MPGHVNKSNWNQMQLHPWPFRFETILSLLPLPLPVKTSQPRRSRLAPSISEQRHFLERVSASCLPWSLARPLSFSLSALFVSYRSISPPPRHASSLFTFGPFCSTSPRSLSLSTCNIRSHVLRFAMEDHHPMKQVMMVRSRAPML